MKVLVLGSGPNVVRCADWPKAAFDVIVVINNAWRVRPDWDILIHPEDFPTDRRPEHLDPGQRIVTAADYVPLQNRLGGFVYAGGTMALTAIYWALAALSPRVIGVAGCDMVYPQTGPTHFYGMGTADPLRQDVTLRSLEAKSGRALALASEQGCALVNFSLDESRLVFPRAVLADLDAVTPVRPDPALVAQARAAEDRLNYLVPSGRYWLEEDLFDTDEIDALDALWLRSVQPPGTAP